MTSTTKTSILDVCLMSLFIFLFFGLNDFTGPMLAMIPGIHQVIYFILNTQGLVFLSFLVMIVIAVRYGAAETWGDITLFDQTSKNTRR